MYGKKEYKDWHKLKNKEKYEIGDVFPHESIIERIITGEPFEMTWIPERNNI